MPELSEEEYRALRSLQGTVGAMLRHPDAGALLEEAHKMVDDKAPTPRLDKRKRDRETLTPVQQEMADLKKQLADEKAEREKLANDEKIARIQSKHESQFAALRKQGWMDEGIAGLKKMMEDNGILDVEIAVSHYERLHPPSMPMQNSGGQGGWNLFEQPAENDDLKKLLDTKGESEVLVDNMARRALQDHRQAGRAA